MKKVRELELRVPSPGFPRHLGSWQEAVQTIAEAEGSRSLAAMPPSYVALNNERCLRHIGQMYEFLEEVRW